MRTPPRQFGETHSIGVFGRNITDNEPCLSPVVSRRCFLERPLELGQIETAERTSLHLLGYAEVKTRHKYRNSSSTSVASKTVSRTTSRRMVR